MSTKVLNETTKTNGYTSPPIGKFIENIDLEYERDLQRPAVCTKWSLDKGIEKRTSNGCDLCGCNCPPVDDDDEIWCDCNNWNGCYFCKCTPASHHPAL